MAGHTTVEDRQQVALVKLVHPTLGAQVERARVLHVNGGTAVARELNPVEHPVEPRLVLDGRRGCANVRVPAHDQADLEVLRGQRTAEGHREVRPHDRDTQGASTRDLKAAEQVYGPDGHRGDGEASNPGDTGRPDELPTCTPSARVRPSRTCRHPATSFRSG